MLSKQDLDSLAAILFWAIAILMLVLFTPTLPDDKEEP